MLNIGQSCHRNPVESQMDWVRQSNYSSDYRQKLGLIFAQAIWYPLKKTFFGHWCKWKQWKECPFDVKNKKTKNETWSFDDTHLLGYNHRQRGIPAETPKSEVVFHSSDPCFSNLLIQWVNSRVRVRLVCSVLHQGLVAFIPSTSHNFHIVGQTRLFRGGHFVKAAVARGRGSLLAVVCFQERGEIWISLRLLPPGKPSVTVGVARRRDAEDSDAEMRGDLEAHARTISRQVQ